MWSFLRPSPLLSAVIDDCLETGRDVTAGGAHYNLSGTQGIQVANVADSLAAVKKPVFDEHAISGAQLLDAMRKNFDGLESLRNQLLADAPKYGNDIEWVDELGAKWARAFAGKLARLWPCFTAGCDIKERSRDRRVLREAARRTGNRPFRRSAQGLTGRGRRCSGRLRRLPDRRLRLSRPFIRQQRPSLTV